MAALKRIWRKTVEIFLTVLIAILGAIARSP